MLLLPGITARLLGTYFHYVWVEQVSLLPCLAGVFVLLGGRAAWNWSWPAVGFLLYMIPLPYRVETAMSGPLQRLATLASTFVLQTLGLPALAEGNVILLNEVEIGVVEACSGLRMLVIFFALTTAVAMVSRRPIWEKIVMVASAVPIALFCNLIRITVTGILHEKVSSEVANAVFHDLAGWLMMPLALGMLWAEFRLFSVLLVEGGGAGPINRPSPRPRQSPPPRQRPNRTAARRTRTATPAPLPPAGAV
jgi:exosortase